MIRENRKTAIVDFKGGLELEANPLEINPGAIIGCKNFRVKSGGGYERIGGYEVFDGQPSPTDAEDSEAARALIQAVPGEGDILGVWLFNGVVYAFRNATGGASAKMYKSTGSGWSEVTTGVTLDPDGSYEFVNYNFYASSSSVRMYGVDGVNLPFMFDGTTFTQLTIPGATDPAEHIAAHKNHLFLSYPEGQWVHSGIGDPTKWDTATEGAGAGGIGDDIVAIRPTVGGALAFFCRNRINIMYGSSQSDWQANDVRNQSEQAGAIAGTVQTVGTDIVYLDDRGLSVLGQTQSFGNFKAATIDKPVRKFISARKDSVICSTISRTYDEYRLFFTSNTETEVLTGTFGRGFEGFARTVYPFVVTCVCSLEDSSGDERIFVGASDGFVYELDKGVSFNGNDIETYIKTAFNHVRSPTHRKRFRYVRFSMSSLDSVTLKVKPEFDYGSGEKFSHLIIDGATYGGGGVYGESDWGSFIWGGQIYNESDADIVGTGKNMSLLIYHKASDVESFTVHDATITYSPRGFTR